MGKKWEDSDWDLEDDNQENEDEQELEESAKDSASLPTPEEIAEDLGMFAQLLFAPNPFVNENDSEHVKLLRDGYIWISNCSSAPDTIAEDKRNLNSVNSKGPFQEILTCQSAYDASGRRITSYVSLWARKFDA